MPQERISLSRLVFDFVFVFIIVFPFIPLRIFRFLRFLLVPFLPVLF